MLQFTSEELTALFDTDDFGDIAYWNGNSFNVKFSNQYEAAQMFDISIDSARPFILCKTSDVPGIAQGVIVTVGSAEAAPSFKRDAGGMFVSDVGGAFDESGPKT